MSDYAVDYRNSSDQKLGEDIGIRLFVGYTVQYCRHDISILFRVKRNDEADLEFKIFFNTLEKMYEIVNIILRENKGSKFFGNNFAVIGEWNFYKDGKYNCEIKNKKQIMFDF